MYIYSACWKIEVAADATETKTKRRSPLPTLPRLYLISFLPILHRHRRVQDLLSTHLPAYPSLSPTLLTKLSSLQKNYAPWLGPREWYWVDAAVNLGLVDTEGVCGVAFGMDPGECCRS